MGRDCGGDRDYGKAPYPPVRSSIHRPRSGLQGCMDILCLWPSCGVYYGHCVLRAIEVTQRTLPTIIHPLIPMAHGPGIPTIHGTRTCVSYAQKGCGCVQILSQTGPPSTCWLTDYLIRGQCWGACAYCAGMVGANGCMDNTCGCMIARRRKNHTPRLRPSPLSPSGRYPPAPGTGTGTGIRTCTGTGVCTEQAQALQQRSQQTPPKCTVLRG